MNSIVKSLRKRIRRLLRRYHPHYQLNYHGRGTLNFIDVGSVSGLPAPWNTHAHLVRYLLNFEPNDAPTRGPNFITYNTAVWDADETRPFYIYRSFKNMGSSLFPQNVDYVRANYETLRRRGPADMAQTWFDRAQLAETRLLRCRPLDAVLREESPGTPFHFLKIDAQGAESRILKGAENLLATTCVGLYLELFTIPLYQGIDLLDAVQAKLEAQGYRLARKNPAHGTFDSQHDCLFLHTSRDPEKRRLIERVYGI